MHIIEIVQILNTPSIEGKTTTRRRKKMSIKNKHSNSSSNDDKMLKSLLILVVQHVVQSPHRTAFSRAVPPAVA